VLSIPVSRAPHAKRKTVSLSVAADLMYLSDIALLLVCGVLAVQIDRHMGWVSPRMGYFLVTAIAACTTVYALNYVRDYAPERWRALGARARALPIGLLAGTATIYVGALIVDHGLVLPGYRSHAVLLLSWLASAGLAMGAARMATFHIAGRWRRDGRLRPRLALFGTDEGAAAFTALLADGSDFSPRVYGFYRDDHRSQADLAPTASAQAGASGLPCLGMNRELIDDGLQGKFDAVVMVLPKEEQARVDGMAAQVTQLATDVYACPWLATETRPLAACRGIPVAVVAVRPLSDWQLVQKRALDLLIGSILLVVLAPTLLLIALIVKLDSAGPVLFRQTRIGFNNVPFVCFKFRTMFHHAADHLAERQTTRNDARVTRFGRWLRRSSLDEMPQLWNVLRGDMSLIGPRPHAPNTRADGRLFVDVVSNYAMRHRVKPGITGWAQVNGWRGETATVEQIEQRVRHDLYYIQNWSLALEFRILVLTSFRGFFASQAF
jgi:Undecaprenyl-phosphate glucose phosphotransferase